jgi:hypothetical protein
MLDAYCAPMLKAENPLLRMKAKRLLNYWALLTDKTFFNKRIQTAFFQLYKEIDDHFPELTFELSGRIKGLISTLNKVEEIETRVMQEIKDEFIDEFIDEESRKQELTNGEKDVFRQSIIAKLSAKKYNEIKGRFAEYFLNYNFKNNPFNRMKDFFAFRIILEDDGNGDKIKELYQVVNLAIEFFNNNTFEVCPSCPVIQTGPLLVNSPIIYIPTHSGIKEQYAKLVKDYVIRPKKDGYQSVHFAVFDPYTERFFEVQVRTRSMDIISSTISNHDTYKKIRYGKIQQEVEETIDYSRIHVKGFRYFKYTDPITCEEKEFISDRAGITEAIPIKLEFEHFLMM